MVCQTPHHCGCADESWRFSTFGAKSSNMRGNRSYSLPASRETCQGAPSHGSIHASFDLCRTLFRSSFESVRDCAGATTRAESGAARAFVLGASACGATAAQWNDDRRARARARASAASCRDDNGRSYRCSTAAKPSSARCVGSTAEFSSPACAACTSGACGSEIPNPFFAYRSEPSDVFVQAISVRKHFARGYGCVWRV